MNKSMLILAIFGALALTACDRPTVIVPAAPATPVTVPGPAGPSGATGATGKSGENTTVIVMPPASAPAN